MQYPQVRQLNQRLERGRAGDAEPPLDEPGGQDRNVERYVHDCSGQPSGICEDLLAVLLPKVDELLSSHDSVACLVGHAFEKEAEPAVEVSASRTA